MSESEVCKKWYIRDEVCGLTKKKEKKLATVRVGHFSLEKRRLKIRQANHHTMIIVWLLYGKNVFIS